MANLVSQFPPKTTGSGSRQPHAEPISSGTRIGSSEGGIASFPGSTGAEAETDPGRPGSSLEEQHREDDPEGKTHSRADQEGGEAVVPLLISISSQQRWGMSARYQIASGEEWGELTIEARNVNEEEK